MQTSAERAYTESLEALALENIAFLRSIAHKARNGIVLVDRSGLIQVSYEILRSEYPAIILIYLPVDDLRQF
ncbi:MAG: hypothetical protein KJP23_10345 [Deltaproteobacteria bacterium]|nr:hypothetical protein [Deltaproteobacteria bacterium]